MLKANLVAEMMTDSHEIRIINTGKAEAKNVTIQLEGDPFFPEGSKGNNVIKETIIPVIGPSAYIDLIIYRHDAMKPQFTVTITWVDGSEEAGLFKSTLNLF